MSGFASGYIRSCAPTCLKRPWGWLLASVTSWNNIRTRGFIRCFAKIDSADENAEIAASDYQFSPADWALDGLADNVILEGALLAAADGYALRLVIDKSLAESEVDSDALAIPL